MVDAVRCAIEVQNGKVERNAGLPSERRIEFRVGTVLCQPFCDCLSSKLMAGSRSDQPAPMSRPRRAAKANR